MRRKQGGPFTNAFYHIYVQDDHPVVQSGRGYQRECVNDRAHKSIDYEMDSKNSLGVIILKMMIVIGNHTKLFYNINLAAIRTSNHGSFENNRKY